MPVLQLRKITSLGKWCLADNMIPGKIPRGLWMFGIFMVLAAFGLIIQYEIRSARINTHSNREIFPIRNLRVPNALHVCWQADLFADTSWIHPFGEDYLAVSGDWEALCRNDTNGDGLTNGQHLGDPCCRWRPSNQYFDLREDRGI